MLIALLLSLASIAAGAPATHGERTPAERAQSIADESPRELLSTELLVKGGGRVAWSLQGDRIAYDKAGEDGRYDLYLRDMTIGIDRCLTCKFYDFRRAHALSPAWHPSGRFLVFLAQQNPKRLGFGTEELASPQRGLWSDLWLVRDDGKDYWKLTRSSEQGSASLDPHFSHEGDTLLWSERTLSRKGRWGTWRLRTGSLSFRRGVPKIGKLRTPSRVEQRGVVIAHGFTPDDRRFLVSAQLDIDPAAEALEIYLVGEDADSAERLTRSGGGWHQSASLSPRGDLIAFTSDAELARDGSSRSEIWLMKLDGSDKRRLSLFNDTDNDQQGSRPCLVGDFDWNPRGDRIVAQVVCGESEPTEALYLLKLSESLARPTSTGG